MDWGSPETLEHWRQTWAELCNAKFAEKGLDVRIDHRSYEDVYKRQSEQYGSRGMKQAKDLIEGMSGLFAGGTRCV